MVERAALAALPSCEGWRGIESARSPAYVNGRREGVKWAITWLHERANEMNDPHAKQVLDAAGFNMGTAAKRKWPLPARKVEI